MPLLRGRFSLAAWWTTWLHFFVFSYFFFSFRLGPSRPIAGPARRLVMDGHNPPIWERPHKRYGSICQPMMIQYGHRCEAAPTFFFRRYYASLSSDMCRPFLQLLSAHCRERNGFLVFVHCPFFFALHFGRSNPFFFSFLSKKRSRNLTITVSIRILFVNPLGRVFWVFHSLFSNAEIFLHGSFSMQFWITFHYFWCIWENVSFHYCSWKRLLSNLTKNLVLKFPFRLKINEFW